MKWKIFSNNLMKYKKSWDEVMVYQMIWMKMIFKRVNQYSMIHLFLELDALGDELLFENEVEPDYLVETADPSKLPSVSIEDPESIEVKEKAIRSGVL